VYQNSILREDTPFVFGSMVDVATSDSGDFSITLANVPAGVNITGMTYNASGDFYTLSGTDDVVAAFNSITITPSSNMNTNAADVAATDLNFQIELTTYASGGAQNTASINFTGSVLPATDAMTLTTVNDGTTTEDTAQTFSITLDNAADGANTLIVDGKVYVKMSENYTDTQGSNGVNGTLFYAGNVITTTEVSGVSGISDGSYYVIEGITNNQTLDFSFLPASHRDGSVSMDVYAKNQEVSSWTAQTEILISHQNISFNVTPVYNGFSFNTTTTPSGGVEDGMTQISVAMSNPDSSETPLALSLENIPDGFLVFYGANASSAVLADNIGINGTTTVQLQYGINTTVNTNLWSIPLSGGAIPAYIGLKAPQDWSGEISDVVINIVDTAGVTSSSPFAITVAAVADTVSINPTATFGPEYVWTDINLNATMNDLDASETMTLKLSGSTALDETALFRLDDGSIINAAFNGGIWTLADVPYNQINNIQMLYHDYSGTISAQAQTVDHGANGVTDSSDFSAIGTFTLTQTASSTIDLSAESRDMNIVLNSDAPTVKGGSGIDTLILEDSITLDYSKLENIEKIDLTHGNYDLSAMTLNDIVQMTDSNNTLTIDADVGDSVRLSGGLYDASTNPTGWQQGNTENGYTTYTSTDVGDSVTLKVDDSISPIIS
jgi:hypothetical protein